MTNMENEAKISTLLGLRDRNLQNGEASDTDTQDLSDQDRGTLVELIRLKAELNALPPVTPDASVWEAIQERAGLPVGDQEAGAATRAPGPVARPAWLQRFPLATAATVFLATALTIMLWDPTSAPGTPDAGPQVQDPLAQLVLRSQRLESELVSRAAAPALTITTSEEALVYGIADVDAQLNAMYESGAINPAERERLWRQRVMLLESLAEVQRDRAVLRPAIY